MREHQHNVPTRPTARTSAPHTHDLPGTYVSTVPLLDAHTVQSAARTVAEHATDATEARLFLAQLGLCGQAMPPRVVPLACGHPSTEGVRRPFRKGVVCRACENARTHPARQEAAA
jgi:hypothetical protein